MWGLQSYAFVQQAPLKHFFREAVKTNCSCCVGTGSRSNTAEQLGESGWHRAAGGPGQPVPWVLSSRPFSSPSEKHLLEGLSSFVCRRGCSGGSSL